MSRLRHWKRISSRTKLMSRKLAMTSSSRRSSLSTGYSRTNSRCSVRSSNSTCSSSQSLEISKLEGAEFVNENEQSFECCPKCTLPNCEPPNVSLAISPPRLSDLFIETPVTSSSDPNSSFCSCGSPLDTQVLCQSFSESSCTDNTVQQSEDNTTNYMTLAAAEAQVKKALCEVNIGLAVLEEELDAIKVASEVLEERAERASENVIMSLTWASSALEIRNRQLNMEYKLSKNSMYNDLQTRISSLLNIYNNLVKALEIDTPDADIYCLTMTRVLLDQLSDIDKSMSQFCEQPEDTITDKNTNLLSIINNFGDVVDDKLGPIGARRPRINYRFLSENGQILSARVPRGPMPTHIFPVRVRMYRNFINPVRATRIIGVEDNVFATLARPWGVACDLDGRIIVSDRSNHCIKIFKHDGEFMGSFGSYGTGEGQFNRPAGIAIDARRRLIVADKDNHRIQVFSMEGVFIFAFGGRGVASGQFRYPWDVATNTRCHIVVSDTRNHRIQLFSSDGHFLRKYGFEPNSNMWNYFDSPRGVAFNPEGNIVVTDFNNHKVFVVNGNLSEARRFRCEAEKNSDGFQRPQGVVVDDIGNIIVADSKNHRIQAFDKNGVLIWKFGTFGDGITAQMHRPSGIALSPDGRVVVVDFGNNRVLVF